MREIKFRAWSPSLNRMDSDFTIEEGMYGDLFFHKLASDWLIMQYTGLKDVAGKEVYEGDIVKCTSGCPHVIEWKDEIGGEFGGGMPGWYLSGLITGYGKGYAWAGREEAIGNIYENPELLQDGV